MNSAAETTKVEKKDPEFDPESYRMSLGDHLEELRYRIFLGIGGMILAAAFCLIFGERVMSAFCWPLWNGYIKYGLDPQIITTSLTEGFVVYMQISLISAAAIAAPWMLFQLWQFVRTGLYATERKYVTKYMPYSIALLVAGMLFLYFLVLPITVNFLLRFSMGVPITGGGSQVDTRAATRPAVTPAIPTYKGDPPDPRPGELWIDSLQNRVKIRVGDDTRVLHIGNTNLISPMVSVQTYIDLVVQLLLMFGLTFQLPLVMLALVKIGIVNVAQLRKWRRAAYFGIAVLCGVVVPDVVTGMIAMMVPLIFLYEGGILLALRVEKQRAAAEAAEATGEEEQDGK
jgi:sec-independent protein translocase protein TatC